MSGKHRKFIIAATAVVLGAAPARADFLDFLFAHGAPQVRTAPPPPVYFPPAPAPRVERLDVRREPPARRPERPITGGVTRTAAALKEILRKSGPMAAFEKDPTLRFGDIVVTNEGISVFQGDAIGLHEADQFFPLAVSAYRDRPELVALQRASGLRPRPVLTALATPRPRALTIAPSRTPTAGRAQPASPAKTLAGDI